MTFGRPSTIPEDYVKMDLCVPIPSGDADRETTGHASVAFFNSTM
jgi:hypothetical protein